jgi:dipeptidyl aminopeptidase/acylaminoacyl peptidase
MLPAEAHGYRARESVLHTLAEMLEWGEKWTRDKGQAAAGGAGR